MDSKRGGETPAANASLAQLSRTVTYICGDCRKETEIRPHELVRCHDCGYRVLYKKRSKRMSVFEAR